MKAGLNRRMWTGEATYGRIAAQGAWELRLFGNDGALITRNAIYTEPPCAELLSRDAAPVIARGQTLWKLFPLTFLPLYFLPRLILEGEEGGGRDSARRSNRLRTARYIVAEIARPRWNAARFGKCVASRRWEFLRFISPRCLSRSNEEAEERKERTMDRNIEFLLIPSLERFRDGELTIEEYIVERFYSRII